MLKQITKDFLGVESSQSQDLGIDGQKLKDLGEMISAANLMLGVLVAHEDLLRLPMDINI